MQLFTLTGAGAQAIPAASPWGRLARWLMSAREALGSPPDDAGRRAGPHALPSLTDEFEAFYREHERAVFSYLWRVTSNEQAANDLTQEVFVRAWGQFAKVRDYDKPDAWLFHVATNLALNELRHQRIVGPTLTPQDDWRAVSDHAAGVAERSALRAALAGLPVRQRAALILRELYGYPIDDIAATLDISPAAAKMTLSRARAQLRTLYLKEDAE